MKPHLTMELALFTPDPYYNPWGILMLYYTPNRVALKNSEQNSSRRSSSRSCVL